MDNAKWNINNFKANKNRVLCSDHFHTNCFARDLMSELLDTDKFRQRKKRDRKLVEGAIPTIFRKFFSMSQHLEKGVWIWNEKM